MRLNWDTLFTMQKQLDQYIAENHGLGSKSRFEEKMLALLVELGELANETRCFKYWSNKNRSDVSIILEEYVDNIHFILSIGLEKGFTFTQLHIQPNPLQQTEQFNDVFRCALQFYEQPIKENYLQLVEAYLQLADSLGFHEDDIFNAYVEKNEINYERQNSGY